MMTLKNCKPLFLGMALSLLLLACNDLETRLSIDTTLIEFTNSGNSKTIKIDSDCDWSIYGTPDWVKTSAVSGINSKEITLTAIPNETRIDREQEMYIRTNDGKNITTVKVFQYGLPGGRILLVDDLSEKYFNGQPRLETEDSIVVTSSMRWFLTGPSWLNCQFNGKVSHMNGELKEGSGTICLRAAEVNTAEECLKDTVRIQSEAGDILLKIPVVQLGRYDVKCVKKLVLTDGVAAYFKYGHDVKFIKYNVFEGTVTEKELSENEWRNSVIQVSEVNFNNFIDKSSLKPNMDYTICLQGMPSKDYEFKKVFTESFHTPSETGQPRAWIENVALKDGGWSCDIIMNTFAKGYYFLKLDEPYEDWRKSYLAFIMYSLIQEQILPLKKENARWSNINKNDYIFVTWAVGIDGKLSPVMDVYKASKPSGTRKLAQGNNHKIEHLGLVKSLMEGQSSVNIIK